MTTTIDTILAQAIDNDYKLYSRDNLFVYEDRVYEDLRSLRECADDAKFRVVLAYDDYDYVEDAELERALEIARS